MVIGNSKGEGDIKGQNFLKEGMKLNWNFQRGGGMQTKIPSLGGVLIFSGTTQCNFNLTSPRYNRETEGGRTFIITTCKTWNSLSLPVRQRDSVDSLKKVLWNDLFF